MAWREYPANNLMGAGNGSTLLLQFLNEVVQAQDNAIRLLAGGIRSENEHPIGNGFCDLGGGQPSGFTKLAENGDALSSIVAGGLFKKALAHVGIESDFNGETAELIDYGRLENMGLVQKWRSPDINDCRIVPINTDGAVSVRSIGIDFHVELKRGHGLLFGLFVGFGFFLFLTGLAACAHCHGDN